MQLAANYAVRRARNTKQQTTRVTGVEYNTCICTWVYVLCLPLSLLPSKRGWGRLENDEEEGREGESRGLQRGAANILSTITIFFALALQPSVLLECELQHCVPMLLCNGPPASVLCAMASWYSRYPTRRNRGSLNARDRLQTVHTLSSQDKILVPSRNDWNFRILARRKTFRKFFVGLFPPPEWGLKFGTVKF